MQTSSSSPGMADFNGSAEDQLYLCSTILSVNDTLYDDFAHIHILLDKKFHLNPSFLAWHRYFTHIYESTLHDECGFKGAIPYWDWTLDWEDLSRAPVFDSDYGFGGDGNPNVKVLDDRTCVTDGPLAGSSLKYFNEEAHIHCLLRKFDHTNGRLSGEKYKAETIDQVLQRPNITSFLSDINKIHASVHEGLGGDMEGFSAPNDPLFFLHHAQVDRLWWTWQNNHADTMDTAIAGFNATLTMGGFVKDIQAFEAVNTLKFPFCYTY
ncbi:hypothetical protein F5884DRAFT_827986 [Xylogone sp. PMI_703]|nr:hypothetical protein F5884DRAFT_827986 [Xylogone sp. PMI_703]